MKERTCELHRVGGDFPNYGRWVWKVKKGVETTNMPPWKWVLSDEEVYQVTFYEQSFSAPEDYDSKCSPQHSDPFGKNLMKTATTRSIASGVSGVVSIFAGILLWNLQYRKRLKFLEGTKLKKIMCLLALRRRFCWM